MFRTLILCILSIFLLFISDTQAKISRCNQLSNKVRKAHFYFFGLDYPYHYSIAQLYVESGCRWIISKDKWSSLGYAQITPAFWDKKLSKLFPNWKRKDSIDYFYAQAYILWKNYQITKRYCPFILFPVYQSYNRNIRKVLREVGACCNFTQGLETCLKYYKTNICVWYDKKRKRCKQYRTNCDINYSYVLKIYKYSKYFQVIESKKYKFFKDKN